MIIVIVIPGFCSQVFNMLVIQNCTSNCTKEEKVPGDHLRQRASLDNKLVARTYGVHVIELGGQVKFCALCN